MAYSTKKVNSFIENQLSL